MFNVCCVVENTLKRYQIFSKWNKMYQYRKYSRLQDMLRYCILLIDFKYIALSNSNCKIYIFIIHKIIIILFVCVIYKCLLLFFYKYTYIYVMFLCCDDFIEA